MYHCKAQLYEYHALNLYYFEAMLMLIVVLWLIKWLFADGFMLHTSAQHQCM